MSKPSTLCKAHIFLILFLLLASNSMSVAGAALGVKLPTTGLAATSVPVPRTPSKSAAPPTLPSPWNWDNYVRVTTLAVIVALSVCFGKMDNIALFDLLRKTFNRKNDTVTTKIFYGQVLLVSCVLITLMLIYLYADAEDFS